MQSLHVRQPAMRTVQCSASSVPRRHGSKSKPQALPKEEVEEGTASRPGTGLETLSKLANMLLNNAASLREPRGVAHCLQCKGLGTLECKACKGKGVVTGNKVQRHAVRRMVSQLEEMVGASSATMHDNDWQMSNRCMRCHGKGRCMCSYCQGSGKSGAQSSR